MKSWSESLKPRTSSRFQILLAGLMWSTVGAGLFAFGFRWTMAGSPASLFLPLIAGGILAGAAKSRFLLDRTAHKILARIAERGEGRCAGGFLSLRSWALVLTMVAAGRLLRGGLLPNPVIGTLYVAIGTGLLLSSRHAWQAWRTSPPKEGDARAAAERDPKRSPRLFRKSWILIFVLLTGVAIYHSRKPLPEGTNFRSASHFVPAGDVLFLKDLTYRSPDGHKVHEQEIFDALFAAIDRAEETILLDMFLFNSYGNESTAPLRPLAAELSSRLIDRKEGRPAIDTHFITDPINVVYGGAPSDRITALRASGINVILTDLSRLRDSNPAYSAFWRVFIRWFGNDDGGGPAPHPFSRSAPSVTLRSYFRMLNFRANHRKVFLGTGDGSMTTLISSANPHDGSSAHSNVALQLTGAVGRDIFLAEEAVARFSGGKIGRVRSPRVVSPGTAVDGMTEVVLVTENRIEEAVLETIGECGPGDDLWLAMFYLADRDVVEALLGAAARGARLRLILDPNRDAFGYEKNGIPNRPVAHELVNKSEGAVAIRWYDTQGEQYHSKMVYAERADGSATVILGSANLTRRNLDGYNLELDVMVSAEADAPPMKDIRDYFERVWNNRDGLYTVAYESYADDSAIRAMIYRFQEFTGLCSF